MNMIPTKTGQIVVRSPKVGLIDYAQRYVVEEIYTVSTTSMAIVRELNGSSDNSNTLTVSTDELEVVEVNTQDMIGIVARIVKDDDSVHLGRIVAIPQVNTYLDLDIKINRVETNVYVTIIDNQGIEHSGYLFVP